MATVTFETRLLVLRRGVCAPLFPVCSVVVFDVCP